MCDLLKRIGFVYKQTKTVPRKANEAAQQAFPSEELPAILERVESEAAELYYADGCHPMHNTRTGRG